MDLQFRKNGDTNIEPHRKKLPLVTDYFLSERNYINTVDLVN